MKEVSVLSKLPSMKIPLFESGIVYFINNKEDWADVHKELNTTPTMRGEVGQANTFVSNNSQPDIHLLGVFDESVSTLAHESAHLAFDVCDSVGVEVEAGKANETFCYLLDSIVAFGYQHYLKEQ